MNEPFKALVYIVDDDLDTRSIVASTISTLPVQTQQYSDGASVVAACSEVLPDLIVLDIMMPGMDGDEARERIRKLPGGEYIQIIMLTAKDTMRAKVDSLQSGADDYLTKPFHYQELVARVKSLLRVRELTLDLQEKNVALKIAQDKIVAQERQLLVGQLAATAAHELGQPLAAILLNHHLVETLPPGDERVKKALAAIKTDAEKMKELLEQLQSADPESKKEYFKGEDILTIGKDQ